MLMKEGKKENIKEKKDLILMVDRRTGEFC